MWRRLQKTRWQTRPTRGCRYPAKRQIIYLTGKSRNYLKRGKGKEKKDKRSQHLLVTQAYVCEGGWANGWSLLKLTASKGDQIPIQEMS